MSRKGENIYKRKDGRWEGRYIKGHKDGKAQYGSVFAKSYTEVRVKLNVAKANVLNPSIPNDKTECLAEQAVSKSSCESFSDVASAWLGATQPQWKQSSTNKYKNTLNLYLLPVFGDKEVDKITYDEVFEFGNELLISGGKDGSGLSPKTVNSILSVMKNVFEYAERTKGLKIANIRSISFKQQQKLMRTFTLSEQKKLSNYLYDNLDCCYLGILICLYTGLRIGEICALKWGDISFAEQYIYVHQTIQRLQNFSERGNKTEVVIIPPKSDCSIRKVPIPSNIFELLKANRKGKKAYILSGTSRFMEPRTLQYRFKNILDECGIDAASFHTLRHTFATRCVELGFDIKSLSEILGHASVNITLNRYVHPSMDLKQRNMNMLSELFAVK